MNLCNQLGCKGLEKTRKRPCVQLIMKSRIELVFLIQCCVVSPNELSLDSSLGFRLALNQKSIVLKRPFNLDWTLEGIPWFFPNPFAPMPYISSLHLSHGFRQERTIAKTPQLSLIALIITGLCKTSAFFSKPFCWNLGQVQTKKRTPRSWLPPRFPHP